MSRSYIYIYIYIYIYTYIYFCDPALTFCSSRTSEYCYISWLRLITARVYINLSGETSSTKNPLIYTTGNNRTNVSIQSTTPTEKSADTKVSWSPTSAFVSMLQMTSKLETSPNQSNVDKPDISRTPRPPRPQEGKSNTEVLSVSLSLVLGVLAAVGVVIAVLFVRWKRWVKVEVGKIEHHSRRIKMSSSLFLDENKLKF